MPGSALASFRNSALILKPAFALLSMNMMPSFVDLSSPSSTDTCLLSDRSVLLPTSTIITSFPRSFRTSSIHFEVFKNDARSTESKFGKIIRQQAIFKRMLTLIIIFENGSVNGGIDKLTCYIINDDCYG